MTEPRQKICLCMIVKDEAQVIARCLTSVRPLIDHWVIVDTGSSDMTRAIVRDTLRDVPGELFDRPWVNFAHNRTESLALARSHGDYALLIDADDTLRIDPDFARPVLDRDSYMIMIESPPARWPLGQLFRNAAGWRYAGVLHEFPVCDLPNPTSGLLRGVTIQRGSDGARRKDPEVFRRDAALLENALATEQDPMLAARYRFYLAQSYRDAGDMPNALTNYLIRANAGQWEQEVYVSLLEAAQAQQQLGHPADHILATLAAAQRACPDRAEAFHAASRLCRATGRYAEGFAHAERGLRVAEPEEALFATPWIYRYGLLDEYAVAASWIGRYQDCLEACLRLLREEWLPESDRPRVRDNARLARDRLMALIAQEA